MFKIKEYDINGESVIRDKNGDVICPCCGKKMKLEKVVYNNKGVGRNDPCPCGSGKKYKKCCGIKC